VEEAALLAGMIQKPNLYNPYRHEDRALQRRNIVLGLMHENGYLTDMQYLEATKTPLKLAEGGVESTDAPYFVDLVNDELRERFAEVDFQTTQYRIYTTLDMKLQREAVEAVRIGMKEVDAQLSKRRKKYPEPQVALVAMDPHTGEVRALVGGRTYGLSQLNRALAMRQPGSSFKPFVYAAALRTAITGRGTILTPVSQVIDEPTTFVFDDKTYEPNNFHEEWHGRVTLREALAHSMNIPTVKFAETVGYETVAELARDAGLTTTRGTPAEALGSYEATPLQIASAYTTFSNGGAWMQQNAISEVRDQTELGLTMVTSLRRSQLRLATFVLLAITVLVGGIPLLFLAVPGLREARVGGLAVGWLVLGVAVFPMICSIGWAYTRAAERNERDFVELVERS